MLGNNLDVIGLFNNDYQNDVNNAEIFIPASFPASKYISSYTHEDNSSVAFYQRIDETDIATNITIPNSTIFATYNSNTNSYENIVTNGTCDEIGAFWSYYDNNNQGFIHNSTQPLRY